MVTAGRLLLSSAVRNSLFGLQGPLAFAGALEAWMLADPTSTNVLADDAPAARVALPSRGDLRHLLRVTTVALACLIGPVCAVVCQPGRARCCPSTHGPWAGTAGTVVRGAGPSAG